MECNVIRAFSQTHAGRPLGRITLFASLQLEFERNNRHPSRIVEAAGGA